MPTDWGYRFCIQVHCNWTQTLQDPCQQNKLASEGVNALSVSSTDPVMRQQDVVKAIVSKPQ